MRNAAPSRHIPRCEIASPTRPHSPAVVRKGRRASVPAMSDKAFDRHVDALLDRVYALSKPAPVSPSLAAVGLLYGSRS